MKLTSEQIADVKGLGFLQNRGTNCFSGRIVPKGSVFNYEDLRTISEIAEKFGNGKVSFTSRLCAEVVGIPFDKIEDACNYAKEHGLSFGGTGAKIRPVTSCKGTTCIYGNFDTQKLAKDIYEKYYIGWRDVSLPHKFKIGIGGCPNSCMKPSLNDFGVEGHKKPVLHIDKCKGCKVCQIETKCPSKAAKVVDGKIVIDELKCKTCGVCVSKCPFGAIDNESEVTYKIYVGGTWGKETRMGTCLSKDFREEEIFPVLEKTLIWFKENAMPKERLGKAIDRLGVENLEKSLL